MKSKKYPSCGHPMKRNGKTKAGTQRWRCKSCGASAVHVNDTVKSPFVRKFEIANFSNRSAHLQARSGRPDKVKLLSLKSARFRMKRHRNRQAIQQIGCMKGHFGSNEEEYEWIDIEMPYSDPPSQLLLLLFRNFSPWKTRFCTKSESSW